MSEIMDRHAMLDAFHEVIVADKINEGGDLDAKVSRIFEAISASQTLLAILISLYRDMTGEDITNGVILALKQSLASMDEEE